MRVPVAHALVPARARHSRRRNTFGGRFAFLAMVALALAMCAQATAKASQSVTISWNASADTNTAGYVVYAGSTPTNYTTSLNVGTNTTITVSGLTEGTTNYFAVSAYNEADIAGTPSAPITYITPGRLGVIHNGANTTLSFATAPNHWYLVQASTNLSNWTTVYQTSVATNNAIINYFDTQASLYSQRYYRLVMH